MGLRAEDTDRELEPEPLGLWELQVLGLTTSSRRVPLAHRNAVVRHFRAQGGDEKFNKLLSSWHGHIEERFPGEAAKWVKALAPKVEGDVADIIESIVPRGESTPSPARSVARPRWPGGEEEDEVGDCEAPALPSRAAAAWLKFVATWAKDNRKNN